ncbi:trace amine-associated receptor 5-like [Columba livia]|uniref:Trace amine-associated receptor 5-like n=2 Tax=Columba livia TaxID=8932 RepID=A0A2I0MVP9_COLLI|nr:trace amine-associated receptor 5-like [Columba livia]
MLIILCYEVNGSCYGTHHIFGIHLAFYLACALGTLITVLRNLPVIAVILQFKAPPTNHQHTSTSLQHLSLTLAPLLLGLTMLLFSTNQSVKSCWYFRDDFCRLHTFLGTLFRLTYAFHLYLISID